MTLTVSVVMPTHGRAERLPEVLTPLLLDPTGAEVVVVVDGQDPEAERLLSELAVEHPQLRQLVLDPSRGTARAKLAGAEAATGDVLVLLDDDVRAEPGLLARHLDRHRTADHLVVVGAMPVEDDDAARVDALAGRVYARNYADTVADYSDDPGCILGQLWGGNLSVRRTDYLALGPQLLRYPRLAHEDQHFGRVARAAGLVAQYEPAAAAVHLHQRDWAGMLRESERQGRGQRALHLVHDAGTPFDDRRLPEPLHPLVARVVRASDVAPVRPALLAALRLATAGTLAVGRPDVAVRFAFAATQVTRRAGRRDPTVEALVADCADGPRSD
ncbi:MAG: glycosyltransferase [Frankiales bacterium]|nr:glycosyltransferase [Frankiales bacterium]